MISFNYTILYVADVQKTLDFYAASFGFDIKMVTPEKDYGELDTGSTVLSFAQNSLAQSHFDVQFIQNTVSGKPAGFDIGLITETIDKYYTSALKHGASVLAEPATKPWGQTVAYIRDINGIIIELATPVSNAI